MTPTSPGNAEDQQGSNPLANPITAFCVVFAVIWIFPSLGAVIILWRNPVPKGIFDLSNLGAVKGLAFEQGIALFILFNQVLFGSAAVGALMQKKRPVEGPDSTLGGE